MKVYIPITVCCFLLLIISCTTTKSNKMNENDKAIIEGIAQDAKAGAVILTENNEIYYIEGLDYWKSKYLNKKLVVTGNLVETQSTEFNDSVFISQSRPSMKIIRDAKFRINK